MHGLELLCNSTGASTGIEFARGGSVPKALPPPNCIRLWFHLKSVFKPLLVKQYFLQIEIQTFTAEPHVKLKYMLLCCTFDRKVPLLSIFHGFYLAEKRPEKSSSKVQHIFLKLT